MIHKDYVYFSEWRDFRVFRVPLRSLGKTPELILGAEEGVWGNEDAIFYDIFGVANGQLYFNQRPPETIRRFDESGNHKLIYDHSGCCRYSEGPICVDDKIYFTCSTGITASPCRVLRCYDPKTGEVTVACDDKEFSNSLSQMKILRGRVFFVKRTPIHNTYEYEEEILSAALK